MQEQRESQLEYERAVIRLEMEARNDPLTVGRLRELSDGIEPVEFGYPGNRTKQASLIKTREEVAREKSMRISAQSQMSQRI